jgi:hypothetical protein
MIRSPICAEIIFFFFFKKKKKRKERKGKNKKKTIPVAAVPTLATAQRILH